jgi:4-carboxymuconolactone decarboxylase
MQLDRCGGFSNMTASTRFPEIDLATATDAQRHVAEQIKSGPRKAIFGPFIPLLHAPELAQRIQKVGEYLRFESSLPKDVLECAIITVARRWKSGFEWKYHAPLALAAGVPAEVVQGIEADAAVDSFPGVSRLVISLCREALASGNVGEANFREAESLFGLAGVLELLTVCGYYSTLAMYLNTAGITD